MNVAHLVEMGGYGWYVWPAYAITLLVFGLNFFLFSRLKFKMAPYAFFSFENVYDEHNAQIRDIAQLNFLNFKKYILHINFFKIIHYLNKIKIQKNMNE